MITITGWLYSAAPIALAHILHPWVMQSLTNSRLYLSKHSEADVMSDLTKAIFDAGMKRNLNAYHQHVQTAYVQIIASIIDPFNTTYDHVSKVAALKTLNKIKILLSSAVSTDEETKAHRENLQFIISNALKKK